MDSQFSKILLQGFQDGDSEAAAQIYSRYAERLAALVRKRLSQRLASKIDADDVLQTVFQEFFDKADRGDVVWRKEGDLWRLLAAICINHAKREVEFYSAKKRNAVLEEVLSDRQGDFGGTRKLAELLEELLRDENEFTQQLIRLRLAGLTIPEISAETGRSQRTVRRMLQSLKAKMAMVSELDPRAYIEQSGAAYARQVSRFNANYHDFDLLKMLGAGAFGKVYFARERASGAVVAIKALRKSWLGDANAEALFLNEARMLSSIEHPNIVKFLDAGPLPNGSWFIVLEYVSGLTIDRASFAECDIDKVLRLLRQVCSALGAIHAKGLSHGDLKPANIIVSNEGLVRLIDFGFSYRRQYSPTKVAGGTVGFLPPEMIGGPAADMYAFGKVALFLEGKLSGEAVQGIRSVLQSIAVRCCQLMPDERPSALEMLDQLDSMGQSSIL